MCFTLNTTLLAAFAATPKNTAQKSKITMSSEAEGFKQQGVLYYSQNNLTEAYKQLSRIPEKERDEETYLLMANIFQDNNKPIEAIYHLQKALQVNPKYYKAYYNLGNLYMEDNKLNSAIANFKDAIKYKPDFAYSYYNLGICYYNLFDYKDAKKNFVRAMMIIPTVPEFYYNLSLTYTKMNDQKKADEAMATYTKLKNEDM